jgi:class 3 adenylate cyclase
MTLPKITFTNALDENLSELFKNLELSGVGSNTIAGVTSSFWPQILQLDEHSREKLTALQDEIDQLRRKLDEESKALQKEKSNSAESAKQLVQIQQTYSELRDKERFGFLLNCVNKDGHRHLLESESFRSLFLNKTQCQAFIMSIDIRRSTELMLKARSADEFAAFTTKLCSELMEIIKDSYGVIDKFTGDGVLAYFPSFFSGKDAAYQVVSAADKCHVAFKKQYDANRRSFKTIYTNVGLGIGIDYGEVQLVQIAGGLTVVGEPVVYACRLSGAPADMTLLNELAYEMLVRDFSKHCFVEETSLEIKHEGPMLAYSVRLNNRFAMEPDKPEWVSSIGVRY